MQIIRALQRLVKENHVASRMISSTSGSHFVLICAALAERIGKIEERYMFWDACNAAFDGLEACMPGIMQTLKQLPVGGTYEFEVEGTEENQIFKKLREGFFADGSILALSEAEGMTIYADYEVSKDYIVTVQQRFIDEIAGNEEFKYK